jgi:hypothetical protein
MAGELFIVDRATRLVLHHIDVPLPLATLRDVLGRPPAIDGPELTSWGRVTSAELEALVRAMPLQPFDLEEELGDVRRTSVAHPPDRTFWSLVFTQDHACPPTSTS